MSQPQARHSTSMPAHGHHYHGKKELAMVSLGALGVVYGDIGTSPLYAMKECLTGEHGAAPTPANVYGVLSLVFWALTLVVVIKYLMFVLRADNKGEGGIQALAALVSGATGRTAGKLAIPILMALFGTGLLYGEGVLTPAISVLSAVEGLNVATTSVEHLVLPITVAILVGLFVVQRFGTHRIGTVFGYVMLLWFISIGIAGARWVLQEPRVLHAVDPRYGFAVLSHHGWHGFLLLGSVFLVVTGGEALYADMGHFGRGPIRWGSGWSLMTMGAWSGTRGRASCCGWRGRCVSGPRPCWLPTAWNGKGCFIPPRFAPCGKRIWPDGAMGTICCGIF